MLDTDPTGDVTNAASTTSAADAATTSAADAAEGTPPAKAPRRRRATKSAAPAGAPADSPAADSPSADSPAAAVAADSPVDAGTETEAAPAPKKAPRKRAPRKAAAPAAEPAIDLEPAADKRVVDAVEDDLVVVEAAVEDTTAPAGTFPDQADTGVAPAKRTRSRGATAIVSFQAPESTTDDVADEAPAPRRRRRAGTEGAVSPADLVPALIAPEAIEFEDDRDVEDEEARAEDDDRPRRRRRGRRGRGPRRPEDEVAGEETDDGEPAEGAREPQPATEADEVDDEEGATGTRRRRRRRRSTGGGAGVDVDEPGTVVHVREPRPAKTARARDGGGAADEDGVRGISGSTRMAAKRVRRQEGRDSGRRRQPILSEAEFLARREAVDRTMVVRQKGDRTQMAVLEDGVLVEHYVTRASAQSFAGNVYLGTVQNVLPSMEAAFVDIGKGRNAVLYAGEVNYGGGSGGRKIESVLKSGQSILVQVSKDPIGHKGARLTGQVSLPGRYLVYVPEGSMTGISRKLPEQERDRLKAILKKVVPDDAGVIIRTAAEGASEEEIAGDVRRLQAQWEVIKAKAEKGGGPTLLHAEPDLVIRVVRDVFNEDFTKLVVQGDSEWETIREYVEFVAPDLAPRLSRHTSERDVFAEHRVDEQLAKALDRKVWLPSGGSLVIDRTEAMVVIDVNTGKFVGKGGNLEETVTRNNLEAAEEIARQLRLRDLGGIIVIDFIDMVLESNRDLVVRRLVECLGRDRTKHQVAEVTSLGLVQMTRKRVGQGLLESFSEPCDRCNGRGVLVSTEPVDERSSGGNGERRGDRGRGRARDDAKPARDDVKPAKEEPKPAARRGRGGKESADFDTEAGIEVAAAMTGGALVDGEFGSDVAPRRRRRGGRGVGAATVAPADEMVELLAEEAPPAGVDELAGSSGPAEQPPPAQEDLPVIPGEVASVTEPEPVEAEATAARVEAQPDEAQPVTAPEEAAPRRRRRATSRPAGPPVAP